MIRMTLPENSQESEPASLPFSGAASINPLDDIRILRSAGGALFAQAALHGRLARVEWAEEKSRILKMLVVTLLGFACLLCAMLFAGALVLTLSPEAAFRIPGIVALIAISGLGTAIAWRRFQALSALSAQSFAATRSELAADMALLKSKL